jgi:hypothetical protein
VIFAFRAREHFLYVVQTPDEAWPEIESLGSELIRALARLSEDVQSGAQDLVDYVFERQSPPAPFLLEPHRHIIVERERGAHALMLLI